MSRFKNNEPKSEHLDEKVLEARSDQGGGDSLPLGLRTTERPPESATGSTGSVVEETHGEVNEVVGYYTRPHMSENQAPIQTGEKFMITKVEKAFDLLPGMILEATYDQRDGSRMVRVMTEEDKRGNIRSFLVDTKVLLEETVRLSSLEVN